MNKYIVYKKPSAIQMVFSSPSKLKRKTDFFSMFTLKTKLFTNSYFIFILSLLSIGCSKSEDNKKNDEAVTDKKSYYTFVFNNAPKSKFISFSKDTILGGISFFEKTAFYYNNLGIKEYLNPKRNTKDTISITSIDDFKEFIFFQEKLSTKSFLFKNGDTILVDYINGLIEVKIKNREVSSFDYRYESLKDKYLHKNELSYYEKYFAYLPTPLKGMSKNEFTDYWINYQKKISEKLVLELEKNSFLRDSLIKEELISKDVYLYYKKKDFFIYLSYLANEKMLLLNDNNLNYNVETNIDYKHKNINNKSENNKTLSVKKILNENKEFFKYSFFKEFLTYYLLPKYYEEKTTKTSYTYNKSGGSYYEYGKVYDKIISDSLFSGEIKDFLLYTCMDKIAKNLKANSVISYYKKFKKNVTNKNYSDYINSIYQIEENLDTRTVLLDKNKSEYYLEDMIKESGYLAYIVFEASWCSPCKRMEPYQQRLENKYTDKPILFFKISIEKSFEDWKRYTIAKKNNNSYFLVNHFTSELIKNNHVNFIPRYILMSKKGKIINPEAPSPKEKKIYRLLDKYLEE